MLRLVPIVFVAVLLAGCGYGLSEGTVTAKRDLPAHVGTRLLPIYTGETCMWIGKTEDCTPHYALVPYVVAYPEQWRLDLEKCDQDGKCRHGHVYVGEDTYHNASVGDYYTQAKGDHTSPAYRKLHKS